MVIIYFLAVIGGLCVLGMSILAVGFSWSSKETQEKTQRSWKSPALLPENIAYSQWKEVPVSGAR